MFKKQIKRFVPPVVFDYYRNLFMLNTASEILWFGNFKTWQDASQKCLGYDADVILDKTKRSALKVKNGETAFERDSVIFENPEYCWPLVSWLLRISMELKGKLHLIDFGGSLGSTYYQNFTFISEIEDLEWNIIEQKHFVDTGKEFFEDEKLKFWYSLKECLSETKPDLVLFSGVLQYLEEPFSLIEEIKNENFRYIIIDRTGFIDSENHRITVQKVPAAIYPASYPCWFFNEKQFIGHFTDKYLLVGSFNALDSSNIDKSYYKGFIFKNI